MRLTDWLLVGTTALALSCASDEAVQSGDDTDDVQDESAPSSGSGRTKDAGTNKPGKSMSNGGTSGGSSTDDDDDVDDNACDSLSLLARPKSPKILIVLDRSGSMVLPPVDRWTPSVNAITKLTAQLTETVKFGLMLFPAPGKANPATDWTQFVPGLGGAAATGACAAGEINVPIELNSADDIAAQLGSSMPDPLGATPTTTSLTAALEILEAPLGPDAVVEPAYILLVTDGQPTCGAAGTMSTPEDVTLTTNVLDQLLEANVKTYVVGFGIDSVSAPAMEQFAVHGGTEKFYLVEDEATLLGELTRIAGELVPCEYELKDPIENPEFIRVQIDGESYAYQQDWDVDGNKIILHPEAEACGKLRDAKVHDLKITKECEVVVVF